MHFSRGQALNSVIVVTLSLHTFKQKRVLCIKFLVEDSNLSYFLMGVNIEEEGIGRVFGYSCVHVARRSNGARLPQLNMSAHIGVDANSKAVAVPAYFCIVEGDACFVHEEVEDDCAYNCYFQQFF